MIITLLGNCQTKVLSWYIQQLHASFDVKWVCIELFSDKEWAYSPFFKDKNISVITNSEQSISRLQQSDLVIFQHIGEKSSKLFNYKKLNSYLANSQSISISSMFYDTDHPEYLEGMIERANVFNIDIPAHTIIEKHGSKITMQQNNHPHVFYFLELVREICAKIGWNYYSEEQYNQYLKEGYPFG
jgi:hypothetical protein